MWRSPVFWWSPISTRPVLPRAQQILPVEEAAKNGVKLMYVNTSSIEDPVTYLRDLTGGKGYDDVFVYAPVAPVVEQGDPRSWDGTAA